MHSPVAGGANHVDRERFAAARRARGLSQRKLAERAGVHVQTIRAFEQGRTVTLRADTLLTLLGAIGCELRDVTAERAA
jgi:transcriptional regulator with XRE-family HTH domain